MLGWSDKVKCKDSAPKPHYLNSLLQFADIDLLPDSEQTEAILVLPTVPK